MISGKNILNELCNKNETIKNLMMFPVLIDKTKMLKYIQLGEKRGWFASIHQQVLVTGSITQIFLAKSEISKFILIFFFLYIYPSEQHQYQMTKITWSRIFFV